MNIEQEAEPGPERLRRALYGGRVFKLAPSDTSTALVGDVEAMLVRELGPEPRMAAQRMSDEEHFTRIGRIRRELFLSPPFHDAVRGLLVDLGQTPERVAFDPLRLRCVLDGGHDNPRAKAVYYPHRDTWYGHPSALITAWIPLYDLAPEETFVFFPEKFSSPVPNDGWAEPLHPFIEFGNHRGARNRPTNEPPA